jgi:hypothetical protein
LAGAAKLEEYCLPLSIPLGCQRWIGSLSFRINNGSKLSQKCAARMQMSHDAAGTWIGDRQTRIFADHPRPTKHVSIAMQAQPGPCENVYVPFPDYIINVAGEQASMQPKGVNKRFVTYTGPQ